MFRALLEHCSRRRRTLALDWRGHGGSAPATHDFGSTALVDDALAVIETSDPGHVVPVALSHAGWVALELRRQLGARIPKLVLLEWIVSEAPPPFLEALQGLRSPQRWRQTVEGLFGLWLHGVEQPELVRFVREEMGAYDFQMWSRAARTRSPTTPAISPRSKPSPPRIPGLPRAGPTRAATSRCSRCPRRSPKRSKASSAEQPWSGQAAD